MGNIPCKGIGDRREFKQALGIIYMAKVQGSPVLGLQMLGLTSDELAELLPSIKEIRNLQTLDLTGNHLQDLPENIGELYHLTTLRVNHNQLESLPESIGNLTELKYLDVGQNSLQTLPVSIGNLSNLLRLEVAGNMLQSLPASIGNLTNLSFFQVSRNQLEALPEEMGRLLRIRHLYLNQNQLQYVPESLSNLTNNLLHLELSNNPLSQDTLSWINTTFNHVRILTSGTANDENQHYSAVLSKMYGAKAPDVLAKLKALTYGSFKLGDDELNRPALSVSGRMVLEEFLEKVPVKNPFDMEVYVPAAKELIDGVFKDKAKRIEENKNLYLMAMSLGNCATPVKSLLTQTAIGLALKKDGAISELLYAIIEREAVEEKIQKTLGTLLQDTEKIEQVQGLCNSLFLENAENRIRNKIKITGKRHRLPSKTRYINFSFNAVSKDLAEAFARMYCKTNEQNQLIKDSSGKMILDMNKFRAITEPYLSDHGVVTRSEVENYLECYQAMMEEALTKHDLFLHYDKEDVLPELDLHTQKNKLATTLHAVEKEQLEDVFKGLLSKQLATVEFLGKKYQKPSLMAFTVVQNSSKNRQNASGSTQNRNLQQLANKKNTFAKKYGKSKSM
ncbi:leucine-rich repeat domain-containing protein [Ascidiimonas sp. W6]|uniref:leucine-rich repeat domain-containing protein n=1 Tax=Ascidiimonas meishanensis TaxID=3128903 RepID=UPI0030ECF5D6